MLSEKYDAAVRAYEHAYSIEKSGNLAAQIHQAYLRAGKPEQGESVVLKWLQENPNDATCLWHLGIRHSFGIRHLRFVIRRGRAEFLP